MAAPAAIPSQAPVFARQTLLAAIEAKDAVALRQSLAQGASANTQVADGNLVLHQAVIQRWPEGVRMLLAAGADRSAKNNKGHTAADVALELGYTDMAELLAASK
jgi:ankyrin repeat protein